MSAKPVTPEMLEATARHHEKARRMRDGSWTKDPTKALQFMSRKDAAGCARGIQYPPTVTDYTIMGFRLWFICDDHMNLLTEVGMMTRRGELMSEGYYGSVRRPSAIAKAYTVWISAPWGESNTPCETFDEALQLAIDFRDAGKAGRHGRVRVIGDGYEGGYGDDGMGFWDGLTNDERERVEEAGL